MTPIESFTLDEGIDKHGVRKQFIFQGDDVVQKLTYDAEPMLEMAKAERNATAGERWGNGRKVGTIPLAELHRINTTYQGRQERELQILKWLRENQAFVTFDKFLK